MKTLAIALLFIAFGCGGGEPVADTPPTETAAVEEPAKKDCPCGEPDLDTPPPPAPDVVQNVPPAPETIE